MIKSQKGQGLVEFALTFTLLAILLFGIMDFGRVLYMNLALEHASREGARIASLGADNETIISTTVDAAVGVAISSDHITLNPENDRDSGEYASVTINYEVSFITPLTALMQSALMEDALELTSETVMRVE
ncbi:TadE/TadG family type IV pilus assembly protein [Alkalibacillus haloalkaliphilus]|uniref:TadE/TadG family type IV pilus assembly protein n=1 Tax=Alkalibacillus haloalkaliphilus TaxID=94136 RepID=UPI002936C464|nr:TadE/TadG family type IV pilus assembly protein [Alkalibacillus haloalkaliphilus]MDV2580754.1 TadE/TadG family type IV pilus assembly protein [Alkalibacillus haloalkaliphilus]